MCNPTTGCFHHFWENLITMKPKKKVKWFFSMIFSTQKHHPGALSTKTIENSTEEKSCERPTPQQFNNSNLKRDKSTPKEVGSSSSPIIFHGWFLLNFGSVFFSIKNLNRLSAQDSVHFILTRCPWVWTLIGIAVGGRKHSRTNGVYQLVPGKLAGDCKKFVGLINFRLNFFVTEKIDSKFLVFWSVESFPRTISIPLKTYVEFVLSQLWGC